LSIYLDHTASARPTPAVLATYGRQLAEVYANPSSPHQAGRAAEKALLDARGRIAKSLGCVPAALILTSGGSESINMALKGCLLRPARLPRRLLISQGEHAAAWETAAWLETQGCAVERLPLTRSGVVDPDAFAAALSEPAGLISLILVNNETGAINDVAGMVALRDKLSPRTPIHLDAVQAWGKIPLGFDASGVDLMSGSGHKLGAPKGIGWLLRQPRCRLDPLVHGGGQQNGWRAGTENPPLAAALALALEEACVGLEPLARTARELSERLLAELDAAGTRYTILSPPVRAWPILAIAFAGLRGETLVNALSAESIYIASGSACSSRRSKGNRVLAAMGYDAETVLGAVRISFALSNTTDEIREAARAINTAWHRLARP
jgi:cysteine desulfurase